MSIFKRFSPTALARMERLARDVQEHDANVETALNDVHSRLNATEVQEYHEPTTRDEIINLVRRAREMKLAISMSGGKHAMGGQQFGHGTLHVNLSGYRRVVNFDTAQGLVTVESGIQWPELIDWLIEHGGQAQHRRSTLCQHPRPWIEPEAHRWRCRIVRTDHRRWARGVLQPGRKP
jgi:FAD/FMN-containing dehydrogenase